MPSESDALFCLSLYTKKPHGDSKLIHRRLLRVNSLLKKNSIESNPTAPGDISLSAGLCL